MTTKLDSLPNAGEWPWERVSYIDGSEGWQLQFELMGVCQVYGRACEDSYGIDMTAERGQATARAGFSEGDNYDDVESKKRIVERLCVETIQWWVGYGSFAR